VPESDKLRLVKEPRPLRTSGEARGGDRRVRVRWLVGIGLSVVFVLLIWSHMQLSARIEALEAEGRMLRGGIVERDQVIEAHRSRMEDVRSQIDRLQELLDEPLPSVR